MKIVFLTNSIGFGGAEKMMAFVANSLCKRNHNVRIINFNSVAEEINSSLQVFDSRVHVLSYSGVKNGQIARLKKLAFAFKNISKDNAEVIIGFTAFPNYVGRIVGSLKGIPSIMSERGNPYITIDKNNLHSRLELAIINKSIGGVFQIAGAKAFYGEKLQERSIIIPNPIFIKEPINFVPYENREKNIVSVGRLDNYQKRYDIMIKAFSLFVKKHSDWRLKLYGDGSDVEKIKGWITEEGIDEKVSLMGVTKNPMRDISTDGMFLITSDFEGISNSLLEAMAIGMPCVSTDSTPGGARMLIQDGINGLLAPIGDPKSIASAMCKFVENPRLAKSCGNNARDVINRFDADKLINCWEDYIKKIVNTY